MSLANLGIVGVIGEAMALLGLAIVWIYRAQVTDWLRELFAVRPGDMSGREQPLTEPVHRRQNTRWPLGALVLVGAAALIFFGQVLFLLDLAY